MKLIVHPAAQAEFDRKVTYLQRKGLLPNSADLFIDEIERALDEVLDQPGKSRMPKAPAYFRIGPTERFSFSIVYRIVEAEIHVIAIAAPQRRPGYWKRRRF